MLNNRQKHPYIGCARGGLKPRIIGVLRRRGCQTIGQLVIALHEERVDVYRACLSLAGEGIVTITRRPKGSGRGNYIIVSLRGAGE